MKRLLILTLLVAGAACAGAVNRHTHINIASGQSQGGNDNQSREEIHQSYQLTPGAHVEISGINGTVQIETSDTNTAEIDIVRTAGSRKDLDSTKIIIEHTANSLTIRGENNGGFWRSLVRGEVKQQVVLRAPRQIALEAHGINGRVKIGEVEGGVDLSGINGGLEVAQTTSHSEIHGINGGVTLNIKSLGKDGLEMSGINGGVELRLAPDLNADLEAHGINGSVRSDIQSVSVEKENRSNYYARIGAGGSPISINGINGGVRLTAGTGQTRAAVTNGSGS